jgi:hypothetical protein
MNRRNLIIAVLIVIITIVGPVTAAWVWSICDESANPGCADEAKSKGFWNFQYDDAAPYTTAGLYCCWWERWYKWQKFSTWKGENTMNLGSSEDVSIDGESLESSAAQVETKSFCPSCCATCDDEDPAALKARSDAIMAKKPWLTEGKNKVQPAAEPTGDVTEVPAPVQAVMTFSDAK